METYYKILNEQLNHHGFQYSLGLNVDFNEFNPSGSCHKGGLYFTTKENLFKFFDFGIYIAEIEIPDDAQIYEDPNGDKYKADKIIIKSIKLRDGMLLRYVKNKTPQICLEAVQLDGEALQFVENQTLEICLAAIRQNCHAIRFVKHQTHELCMEAVKQNGYTLKHVQNQTIEICWEAIRQTIYAIGYAKKQTDEMCLYVVSKNGFLLKHVIHQTPEICRVAVEHYSTIC